MTTELSPVEYAIPKAIKKEKRAIMTFIILFIIINKFSYKISY
mgnify:CR=1 FL=1